MQFIKVHSLSLESYLVNIDAIDIVSQTKGGNTCLFLKSRPACICVESIDEIFAMINA